MAEQDKELDPAVLKLIEHGKIKQIISWNDVSDFLPQELIISDKMEEILVLLAKNNIQLIEDTPEEA